MVFTGNLISLNTIFTISFEIVLFSGKNTDWFKYWLNSNLLLLQREWVFVFDQNILFCLLMFCYWKLFWKWWSGFVYEFQNEFETKQFVRLMIFILASLVQISFVDITHVIFYWHLIIVSLLMTMVLMFSR